MGNLFLFNLPREEVFNHPSFDSVRLAGVNISKFC